MVRIAGPTHDTHTNTRGRMTQEIGRDGVLIRDWSLITGRWRGGGATKWHVKFYPYEKGEGGAEKVLAMLKGGGRKRFWGSV